MGDFKLPTEIPVEKYPPPEVFINEALDCVRAAASQNITLRIMGGLAIYLHSKNYEELWKALGRLGERVFTDIDFMSYSTLSPNIMKFFTNRGYSYHQAYLLHHGKRRLIFFGGAVPMVDVFLDKLEMCHVIDFRKRLEKDYPTIPLAELLLEKLQIVQINEKDIKDAILLIRAHDIGRNDEDVINIDHIAGLLSDDWGFYYTVTMNLNKIKGFLPQYSQLSEKDRLDISSKIDKMIEEIERAPKSVGWKMRSKIGTRKKWYQEVEEVKQS